MEVFHHINKAAKNLLSIAFVFCCFLGSTSILAEQYRLDVLTKLPTLSSAKIVALVPMPTDGNNENQYLLADNTGTLSLLNDKTLNLISLLPLSVQFTAEQVNLTALTLHPSFSIENEPGYQIFFTAHIEPVKTNNNVARLTTIENPKQLPFDAVITQWKLDPSKEEQIDAKERREVMRIAVPNVTHQIQKIAFNPFSKSWHDDYGLMHIALSDNKIDQSNIDDALYSGVILRINPAKFGLRNYMVPNTNPFLKKSELNNEIFILGAQKISSFTWSKQHYAALLIQHTYDNNQLLAIANKGTDWRKNHQEKHVFPLAKNQEVISTIAPYTGRSLKDLWGHLVYLSNDTKNWQLATIDTATDDQQNSLNQNTWELDNNILPSSSSVKLLFNHHGEPLLLDLTNKQLLSLKADKPLASGEDNKPIDENLIEQPDTADTDAYGTLLLILFVVIVAVVFYRLRPRNHATKSQLRSQFARFDLNNAQTTLSFYKRHESEVHSQLDIADIVESEMLLNNASLNVINANYGNGYNQQREDELRSSFKNEHRHKLIDDEIRQVHLYLTDKNAKMHIVCLYLRKGNQRLTKEKYFNALESVIDWSWFIAKQLNPEATEKRKVKVFPVSQVVTPTQKRQETQSIDKEVQEKKQANITQQKKDELHDIAIHDSEMINSLDKLANLKRKGFLSEEEFSLAKAKILSDITSNK